MGTSNLQPSLAMKYLVRVTGPDADLGEVGLFARTDRFDTSDPNGWMRAEGQLLAIDDYRPLYGRLGTTFGGDGETHFALPDLRGRTAIGAGTGPGATTYEIGQQVGAESFVANPIHTHGVGDGFTTGASAGSGAHSNYQPSLALTPIISTRGLFPSRSSLATAPGEPSVEEPAAINFGDEPYLSELTWLAHDVVPEGWMRAEGQLLNTNEYNSLFSLLGYQYGGAGNSFALPDLRGRGAVGAGQGPGLARRQLGDAFGAESETLDASHAPPHTHTVTDGLGNVAATTESGGGAAQSNLQPSLPLTYAVAMEGTFPSSAIALATAPGEQSSGDRLAELGSGFDPVLTSVAMFAANFAPRGYFEADGRLLPISQHTAVFSLLWNDYGGDARSSFGLPDLRGRLPVGIGAGVGLTEWTLAEEFGLEESVLDLEEIAPHTHELPSIRGDYNGDGVVDAADYTVWRDGGSPDSSQAGYEVWASNFGATLLAGGSDSEGVPEPTGAVLALTAFVAVRLCRRFAPS